jgi:pyrroloquinoline quinone biosynthesis protein D
MEGSSKPRLASHARLGVDRVSGNKMLLAPETALALNPTASAVLELCDGERTLEEVIAQLASRFDAPAEELRGDIEGLLGRLAERGYIVMEV